MSQANQNLLKIHALLMGGGLLLGYLAVAVSEWFLVGIFVLMIFVNVLAYRVRCHNCRWPLFKRWWGYVPFAPGHCPKCGEEVE